MNWKPYSKIRNFYKEKGEIQMKGKRILSLLIVFVILLSNIQALAVGDNEIDYKDYVELVKQNYKLKNNGKEFNTPTPIFKATINNDTYTVKPFIKPYKTGEEQIEDDSLHQDSRQIEPHITVPVGTKINLEDISIGGDGRNIKFRDWQIYKRDKDYKEYDRVQPKNNPKKVTSIKADKEGYILVFLNVADNLKYESYNNWSDKGNWREPRKHLFEYKDKKITGWYFTVLKIKVEKS